MFKDVKNKNVRTPEWPTHPYGKDQLKTKGYITPVKDVRSLLVSFPIPDLQDQHKSGVIIVDFLISSTMC